MFFFQIFFFLRHIHLTSIFLGERGGSGFPANQPKTDPLVHVWEIFLCTCLGPLFFFPFLFFSIRVLDTYGRLSLHISWGPARGSGVWSGMSSNPNGSPISADVNGRAKCEMRMKLCWMQSSLPNPIAPIRASGPAVKGASKQNCRKRAKCKGKGSSPASPAPCGPTLPLGYNACMISALARPAHRRVFWSDCDGGPLVRSGS
ncbi:hypothetical protein HDV62DRAFT_373973 [Trichoderma sp. SZMC 28011]